MSNPIHILAKHTLFYGLSTILARVVNFLILSPLYTRILSKYEFGKITEFYVIIALLQVLLTYGMETTYFKFATDKVNKKLVFFSAYHLLFFTTLLFYIITIFFSATISDILGYGNSKNFVIMAASILFLDGITTLFFAKLRLENKTLRFVFIKSIKIFTELFFNIVLIFGLPLYFTTHSTSFLLEFLSPTPDGSYMLFAGLISCISMVIMLIPQFLELRLKVDREIIRKMLIYTFPLLIASLPGVLNDNLNRLMFRYFSPPGEIWQEVLSLFQASVKLSVIMLLFIQMFRYAAEPYFFSQKQNINAKQKYAAIMDFFIFCGLFILIASTANLDILKYYLGKDFREATHIVPIVMTANLFLGISFNLSIWYKLSSKTWLSIPITLSGLLVSFLVIYFFMPIYGYMAAAFSYLLSYVVVCIMSYFLSLKYYKIDYNLKFIVLLLLFSLPLLLLTLPIRNIENTLLKYFLLESIPILFILIALKLNREIRGYCFQIFKHFKSKLYH